MAGMKPLLLPLAIALAVATPLAGAADAARQAEVAKRGADVMPFDLKATTHVFTKTGSGGVQKVVAKDAADAAQVALVRRHLKQIRGEFLAGDFSAPAHIHGTDMPGLAELQAARPGQVAIGYREVPGGAELAYTTRSPKLVRALHEWFDAQLSDHGADAMAGDMPMHHHHPGMSGSH